MENNLDELFRNMKKTIFYMIREKNIDISLLAFDLRTDTQTFFKNFDNRIEDFSFYLKTLSLVENWEG